MVWSWHQNRCKDQRKRIKYPEINLPGAKTTHWEWIFMCKGMIFGPYLLLLININSKWIKGLNVKLETVKNDYAFWRNEFLIINRENPPFYWPPFLKILKKLLKEETRHWLLPQKTKNYVQRWRSKHLVFMLLHIAYVERNVGSCVFNCERCA